MELDPALQSILMQLGAKRTMLRQQGDQINTLVLGSSHGDFGFNPSFYPGSFNLCCRSQDLKHSFYLYQKLASTHPTIKSLVLFYSVFSSGNFMEKSSTEGFIGPVLNELFDLGLAYESAELANLSMQLAGKLSNFDIQSDGIGGFLPTFGKGFMSSTYGAEQRASDHLKLTRSQEANLYLVRTLLLAKHLGHRVCIVIPPAHSDYRLAVKNGKPFVGLMEILNDYHIGADVSTINLLESDLFSDAYFGDFDHLQPLGLGVEILTRIVAQTFARLPQ